MKERNHTFDFLCGLCILRMILLHVVSMCGHRADPWMGKVMAWTFFFMCFFFFKAGYFNKTVAGNSWEYCKDRAKRLLVPYIVWGAIGSIIYFGFHYLYPDTIKLVFNPTHIYRYSHFYGNPPCWFLFSFFTAYIVIHFINKVKHLQWIIILFPFVSYWLYTQHNPLWMSLDNVFMGLYCFLLGKIWHWVQDHLDHSWQLIIAVVFIAFFVYGNRHFHGEYDMSLNKWVQRPWGAGINVTFALCGISGLLMLLPQRRVPLIGFIGEHSMVFFVVHYPLIFLYKYIHLINHHSIRNYADMIFLLIFILTVCALLVPHIESVPWLSGRLRKRKQ